MALSFLSISSRTLAAGDFCFGDGRIVANEKADRCAKRTGATDGQLALGDLVHVHVRQQRRSDVDVSDTDSEQLDARFVATK